MTEDKHSKLLLNFKDAHNMPWLETVYVNLKNKTTQGAFKPAITDLFTLF